MMKLGSNSPTSTEPSRMALYVDGDDSDIHLYIKKLVEQAGLDGWFTIADLQDQMIYPLSDEVVNRILIYMQQEGLVVKVDEQFWRLE